MKINWTKLFSLSGIIAVVMLSVFALFQMFGMLSAYTRLTSMWDSFSYWAHISADVLFLLFAMLCLPLCSEKRKSVLYTIILSIGLLMIFPFVRESYYNLRYSVSKIDVFHILNALLFVVLFIWSIFKKAPRTSVGEHFKAAFKFETFSENSTFRKAGYCIILLSCLSFSNAAHNELNDIAVFVAVLCAVPVFLSALRLCEIPRGGKKPLSIFIAAASILLAGFYASQYSNARILSYLTFILLLVCAGWYIASAYRSSGMKWTALTWMVLSAAVAFAFIPNYAPGINVFRLGDNARCAFVSTAKPYVTIKGKDGLKGIYQGSNVVIPPRYERIFMEYIYDIMLDDRESRRYYRSIYPTAVFKVKNPETGKYETWDVLEHLDYYNMYADIFKRACEKYPFSLRTARYLMTNAIREGKSGKELNDVYYRLFKSELIYHYSKNYGEDFYKELYRTDYHSAPEYIRELESFLNTNRYFTALTSNNLQTIDYECVSNTIADVLAYDCQPPVDFLTELRKYVSAYIDKTEGTDSTMLEDLGKIDELIP